MKEFLALFASCPLQFLSYLEKHSTLSNTSKMRFAATSAVIVLSLLNTAFANSCVWLDTSANNATVPATGYSTCTSSDVSTCCADGDACLSNGYCTGSFGLYRGACTDWSAGECPDTCPDLSFVSEGQTYYLANLYRCNGEGKGEIWWCGDQSADTTAQPCQSGVGTTFSMTSIGTFVTPVSLVAAASRSSSQTDTITGSQAESTLGTPSTSTIASAAGAATSSAAMTASNNKSAGNSSTLGIGLGVGLGVPLIAAIMALTYVIARRKGSKSTAGGGFEKQQVSDEKPQVYVSEYRPGELHGKHIQEMAGNRQSISELSARER